MFGDSLRVWLNAPVGGTPAVEEQKPVEAAGAVITTMPVVPNAMVGNYPDWIGMDRLKEQLTLHEGYKRRIYTDTVGKISGGIGRNLTDVGFRPDEIALMFRNDVQDAMTGLDATLPWWRSLDPVRARVMLDMAFNLGMPRYILFANTLGAIKEGRWSDAADGMLASKWAEQVGDRAERLAYMMRTGQDYRS